MSDPLRTHLAVPADTGPGVERDAKIEDLLLTGLDHYLSAEYEQAINVWTRVLFLDRGHARARAYIDRARSALGERMRESEELLHRGVAAFDSGDTHTARELLHSAVEHGGPSDVALALLDRLSRLDAASQPSELPQIARGDEGPRLHDPSQTASRREARRVFAAVIVIGVALCFVGGLRAVGGQALFRVGFSRSVEPASERIRTPDEPLIVPRAAESALARARLLMAGGHLYDALRVLDQIKLADPRRGEARQLQAEIQKQLLSIVPSDPRIESQAPPDAADDLTRLRDE